ncbi:MAG: lysophospholipid acyltransferase family protein [Planctomycetota bacterium]
MKITPFRARYLSLLGVGLLRCLGSTWRVRRQGVVPGDWNAVGAFLHGDILMMAHVFRRFGAAVIISQHGDGELIARIMERMGNHAVRGSTTRGGVRALREMVRTWSAHPWGITPDGPKGPRGSVQEGVILLAATSRRPIYPFGFAFSRGKRLRSWDRFAIPAPFARVVVHLGEPLTVPERVEPEARASLAQELARRLQAANAAAEDGLNARAPAVEWPRPLASS